MMKKQASIIFYMLFALIFTSVVLISKSTISRIDAQNKSFSQQITNLQSRIISLSSTLQSLNKANLFNQTESNLSSDIIQLNNRLTQQDKRIALLNEEIESAVSRLKRIDSTSELTRNSIEQDAVQNNVTGRDHTRMDESAFKTKQAAFQAEQCASYRNEMVDPVWSDSTQIELNTIFDQKPELAGAHLAFSECRTSSCQISWTIDEDLSDFERFELENNILAELARIGLDSAIGIGSSHPGSGANKLIVKSTQRLVSQK